MVFFSLKFTVFESPRRKEFSLQDAQESTRYAHLKGDLVPSVNIDCVVYVQNHFHRLQV